MRFPHRISRCGLAAGIAALASIAPLYQPDAVAAQPVTDRTPNISGTWITTPRVLYFQFSHRFKVAGSDADIGDIFSDGKIVNYPTFDLAYGLVDRVMIGFKYSSNSLVAGNFNEWQPYAKGALIPNRGGAKPSLALTAAYNGAAKSFDGEFAVQSDPGRFILLGAIRGFTNGFARPDGADDGTDRGGGHIALAGGAGFRVNRYVTLGGDVAKTVTFSGSEAAWSAAIELGIPYTPHTFSILATNVSSGTLEGTSIGVPGTTYWGFEFTVPFSGFARWGKIVDPDDPEESDDTAEGGARQPTAERVVVEIEIKGFTFDRDSIQIRPGTTVRWLNKDPVVHTSTSDDGIWGSSGLGPGDVFEYTFEREGTFGYFCTPHPFMKGTIVVSGADADG